MPVKADTIVDILLMEAVRDFMVFSILIRTYTAMKIGKPTSFIKIATSFTSMLYPVVLLLHHLRAFEFVCRSSNEPLANQFYRPVETL